MTIGNVAQSAGLTVRTLHYFDAIGLVVPRGRSGAGYRLYGRADIERLQEVLFFRELGFGLEEIKTILDRPDYSRADVLRRQRRLLGARAERLQRMIEAVDAALEGERMNLHLTNEDMLAVFGDPTHRGKVRDIYDIGDGRLLIVATDRISAYDVVLPNGIPDKGAVLTQMAAFWFDLTAPVVPNHFIRVADGTTADELPFELPPELRGRSSIVKKAQRLDVECIARGYLTGSAWAEYQETGRVGGMRVPPGMTESEQFPEPLFTPTTKAAEGHDENMSYADVVALVGAEVATAIRQRTLAVYQYAARYALERGIIIADTKLEFGIHDGEPIIIDEMLTPDSSRFWPADEYKTGQGQHAFDKQYVRDWLTQSGWNREPPAPALPADVIEMTRRRYHEAFQRLTERELTRY